MEPLRTLLLGIDIDIDIEYRYRYISTSLLHAMVGSPCIKVAQVIEL
jgi:hypothetical protein